MLAATLTTRLAQDGIDKKSVTAFSLAFPGLQPQVPVGAGGRWSAAAAAGAFGPAGVLAGVRRPAGDGRGGLARLARPQGGPGSVRDGRCRGGRGRCHLRHRHRRLPHRDAEAPAARRGIGHVAVRLAHWFGGGGGIGPVRRRIFRLDGGLCAVRGIRAAGDAHRPGAGRAGAACGGRHASWPAPGLAIGGWAAAGIPAAAWRFPGAAVRAAAQDRRHAGQPYRPPSAQRPGVQQRGDRLLGRGPGRDRLPGRHLHRRRAVCALGHEPFGARGPWC